MQTKTTDCSVVLRKCFLVRTYTYSDAEITIFTAPEHAEANGQEAHFQPILLGASGPHSGYSCLLQGCVQPYIHVLCTPS